MAIAELSVPALFLAGLAASPHCSLMCGPLQLAQLRRSGAAARATAWLHTGRVSGYTALGAGAGWVGAQGLMRLPSPDVGTWIQIAAALVLAALGLNYLRRPRPACCAPPPHRASNGAPVLGYLARGWAWALLPCAALYAMLLLAALSATPVSGALLMAAFGLGTVPVVAGSALALQRRLRDPRALRRTTAAVLLTFGAASAAMAWLAPQTGLWCRALPTQGPT